MSKKILIAEDSSVIMNLIRKILAQKNYEVMAAKDGKKVLELVDKENFDLILMDINIPKMDGIACTRQIRAMDDEQKARVPIFAITGNARNYSVDDFKRTGIDEYLEKPLDFDRLVKLVDQYLA